MNYYMVFGTESQGTELYWLSRPIGVFKAADPDSACRAAAKKAGGITNFAAVACSPWGIASMQDEEEVEEYGRRDPEDELIARAIKRQRAMLAAGIEPDPEPS